MIFKEKCISISPQNPLGAIIFPICRVIYIILSLAVFLAPVHAMCQETSNPEKSVIVDYYKLGKDIAWKEYGHGKAFGAGFSLGIILPVAAPLLGSPAAYFKSVRVPEKYLLSLNDSNRERFIAGYTQSVRTNRTGAYIIGGLVGSATILAIIIGSIDWSNFGTT